MRVFVEVIDTRSGISQNGMIEESVQKGFDIANALGHFGVNITTVDWDVNNECHKYGKIRDTTKVVSVITI